jgi:probable phosphoglycerate mutase
VTRAAAAPDTGPPVRLLLVRHGTTAMTRAHQVSGVRTDPWLDANGREQARRLGARLAAAGVTADVVVASPLRRARETADAIAAAIGVEVVEDAGLVECDFGDWEGLTPAEIARTDAAAQRQWFGDATFTPPGGESLADLDERVTAAMAAWTDRLAGRPGGARAIVVTHVTPIKAVLKGVLDVDWAVVRRMHTAPTGVSEVHVWGDGHGWVVRVNDTAHLDGHVEE